MGDDAPRKSLLSNAAILYHKEKGNIIIEPFNELNLGTASYDVALGPYHYRERNPAGRPNLLNPFDEASVRAIWNLHEAPTRRELEKSQGIQFGKGIGLDDQVILLAPGETVLGHTLEYIGGRNCIETKMQARSSIGRNFIAVCKCAGWGDVGFINRWTMEITNMAQHYWIPLVVGRRVAQIAFFEVDPINAGSDYAQSGGKYQASLSLEELKRDWTPDAMLPKMWKDREVRGVDDGESRS